MVKNLARLSVFALLIVSIGNVRADGIFLKVRGNACENISSGFTRSEIRYKAYDKAALQAIKNSSLQETLTQYDEHTADMVAYQIADKALNDVTVITTKENDEKICVEISGTIENTKVDEIIAEYKPKSFNPQKVKEIAKKVNAILPKSIYETTDNLPLIFIKNIEYYNHKSSAQYTELIKEKLVFEPRILITDNIDLADYFIVPKLLRSEMEKIGHKNMRYNMSVSVEVHNKNGEIILNEIQNRFIIIEKNNNLQQIAQKLLAKLIEDCLNKISNRISGLQKY